MLPRRGRVRPAWRHRHGAARCQNNTEVLPAGAVRLGALVSSGATRPPRSPRLGILSVADVLARPLRLTRSHQSHPSSFGVPVHKCPHGAAMCRQSSRARRALAMQPDAHVSIGAALSPRSPTCGTRSAADALKPVVDLLSRCSSVRKSRIRDCRCRPGAAQCPHNSKVRPAEAAILDVLASNGAGTQHLRPWLGIQSAVDVPAPQCLTLRPLRHRPGCSPEALHPHQRGAATFRWKSRARLVEAAKPGAPASHGAAPLSQSPGLGTQSAAVAQTPRHRGRSPQRPRSACLCRHGVATCPRNIRVWPAAAAGVLALAMRGAVRHLLTHAPGILSAVAVRTAVSVRIGRTPQTGASGLRT